MLLLMVTMLLYPVLRFWMFVFAPGGTVLDVFDAASGGTVSLRLMLPPVVAF